MISSPLTANLIITYHCNLHCPFCFEQTIRQEQRKELSTEQWCNLIDELSEMKVFNLLLTGGEIFFYPGIWTILEHIVHGKMRYKLITNGTLIDEKVVARLKELGQCGSVQISLDGLEEDNDSIRGKGMFQKSLKAVKMLSEAGFIVNVNTVVSKNNYRHMPEFASYLSSLPIKTCRFNAIHEDEACKNNPDTNSLSEKELAEFISLFNDNWDKYPKLSRYLGAFVPFAYLQNYYPLRDPNGCIKCRNPHYMVSIHPDGVITPCIDKRMPTLGQYPQDSIQNVWKSKPFDDFRNAVQNGMKLTTPKCVDCHYAYYCRRYCPNQPTPHFCLEELRKHLITYGITVE